MTARGLPLDRELAQHLDRFAPLLAPVLPEHVGAMRKGAARMRTDDAALARGGTIAFKMLGVRSEAAGGADIEALLLRPANCNERLPGLCFLHGGGMVSGDPRTGIDVVLDWVAELGIAAVSIGYRLAPEHRHPVPVEDCYAALEWMDAHRDRLSLDGWPLILAGASAGGGLAAGVALLARERAGPQIADLLLMGPMLDDTASFPSSVAYDANVPWDARSNRTGWNALLAGRDEVPPEAAPIRATDLSDMPACFLDVGAVETFRDETIDFAARLAAAGNMVELHVWAGAFHGFDVLAAESRVARAARATRLDYLRRRLLERTAA